MNNRERFLACVKGEKTDRVPVFPLLMFLPADRFGITYKEFATNGRSMAAAQLFTQNKFDLDAITACSDAFRVSADLGGKMAYPEDKPPYVIDPIISSAADLDKLGRPDPGDKKGRMADRVLAVEEMVRGIAGKAAVLGWVDMPFTEACSVCGITNFMMMISDNPVLAHRLLAFLTKVVTDFSLAQVKAGADMIGCGDAASSLISAEMYREFALPYEKEVIAAVHKAGCLVKLHICGNTTALLEDMAGSGADLFNVDHLVPLSRAKEVYGSRGKCYKGNLNPVTDIMNASPKDCVKKARECIEIAKGSSYMLSGGCEIPAETKDEVMKAFCEAPKSTASTKYEVQGTKLKQKK